MMGANLQDYRMSLRRGLSELTVVGDDAIIASLHRCLEDPKCANSSSSVFAGIGLALLGDPHFIEQALNTIATTPGVVCEKPASAFIGALSIRIPHPAKLNVKVNQDAKKILDWYKDNMDRLRWEPARGVFVLTGSDCATF